MKPICERTCTKAWLKAVNHLRGTEHWRDYNLMLEIAEPMRLPTEDRAVHELMDAFLIEKASMRDQHCDQYDFPGDSLRSLREGCVSSATRSYGANWRRTRTCTGEPTSAGSLVR